MTTWPESGLPGEWISLREVIDRHGALGPECALVAFRGALLGLTAVHRNGNLYRACGPESVLVDLDGHCELAAPDAEAGWPAPAGLAPYQAPELLGGALASPASDLYSATAVFFECLTGLPPSPEGVRRFMRRQLGVSAEVGPAAESLRDLMEWGMAASPLNRPASAADLIAELDDVASAAYGPDWFASGRRELAGRVAGTPATSPDAAGNADGQMLADRPGWRRRVRYPAVAAVAAVVVLGMTGTAVALSGHFGGQRSRAASSLSVPAPSASASTAASPGPSAAAVSPPSGRKATLPGGAGATPTASGPACAAPTSCSQPAPTATAPASAPPSSAATAPPATAPSVSATPPAASTPSPAQAPPTVTTPPVLDVQLITNQLQPKVVPCGSPPLSFQVFALIKSSETVTPETYHWVRPDGTISGPGTVNLNPGGTSTSTLFTPATDTFSGAETLVFTSPVQGSWSLQLSMTCS